MKSLLEAYGNVRAGHSPHGECGLKSLEHGNGQVVQTRHSPHGECGLKYDHMVKGGNMATSLPARGVWVEIGSTASIEQTACVTPRTGSVG